MAPLDIKVLCNTLICPKGTYVWGLSKPDNLFYVRILSPSLNVIHLKRETPNMISLGLYQNNWPVPKISWGPGGQTLQIIFLIKKSQIILTIEGSMSQISVIPCNIVPTLLIGTKTYREIVFLELQNISVVPIFELLE